jgi:multidrug transporter EmrE-like cation transporter
MGYIYIFLTIIFTVYGQLILKWRMNLKGVMPDILPEKITYFFNAFLDLWVISGFLSAFLASLTWMATLTKFELSYAYPFMSLSFVAVFFLSIFLYSEPLTWQKAGGLSLIILGLIVLTQK